MDHFRVLIVDDSLVIRSLLTDVLGKDRAISIVAAVSSTSAATAILEEHQVDVVTLDVEMPGVSGLHYLPTLKQLDIPVIMLSSGAIEGAELRGLALLLGAAACFNKANALREAPKLIKLVKAAANRRVNIDKADAAARASAKEKSKGLAEALGVRSEWELLRN